MVKVVAPVLLALALAPAAHAGPAVELTVGISDCREVTFPLEPLGFTGFTVCRSLQQ